MNSESHGGGHVKRFTGEGTDAAEQYRRWKKWSRAYLTTQGARGTPDTAYGPLLYTLLDGVALTAVDAVDLDDLEVSGGQHLLFSILDERFPEKTSTDRIGEMLDAVFHLKVERGERTAVYVGRAKEIF